MKIMLAIKIPAKTNKIKIEKFENTNTIKEAKI